MILPMISIFGSSRINRGAGFLRIFTVSSDMLFYVRLVKCLVYDYPARVRKKWRNTAPPLIRQDSNFFANLFVRFTWSLKLLKSITQIFQIFDYLIISRPICTTIHHPDYSLSVRAICVKLTRWVSSNSASDCTFTSLIVLFILPKKYIIFNFY